MDLTIIKLGGSFITHKQTPYAVNREAIRSACVQIAGCLEKKSLNRLIIVHGVGSFGHPPVLRHKLHKGFTEPGQLLAMTRTQHEVNELRMLLMSEMLDAGIPAFLTHASSLFTARSRQIEGAFTDAIAGYMKLGMVPVIGGDMLADSQMGFSVGSGDQITVVLAEQFHARRIIFVSDVNGVFLADPKTHPGSPVIPQIDIDNMEPVLAKLNEKRPQDASGGMAGKLQSLTRIRPLLESGTRFHILSMKQTGLLSDLLSKTATPGTELIIKPINI